MEIPYIGPHEERLGRKGIFRLPHPFSFEREVYLAVDKTRHRVYCFGRECLSSLYSIFGSEALAAKIELRRVGKKGGISLSNAGIEGRDLMVDGKFNGIGNYLVISERK